MQLQIGKFIFKNESKNQKEFDDKFDKFVIKQLNLQRKGKRHEK